MCVCIGVQSTTYAYTHTQMHACMHTHVELEYAETDLAKKKAEPMAIQEVGKYMHTYIHAHTITCTYNYRSSARRPK